MVILVQYKIERLDTGQVIQQGIVAARVVSRHVGGGLFMQDLSLVNPLEIPPNCKATIGPSVDPAMN